MPIIIKNLFIVKVLFIFSFHSLLVGFEGVGELFVVPVCPTHGQAHIEAVSKLLKEKGIGGVIFMEGDGEIQKKLLQRFEREVDRSLLVFQDGEWGLGMRLYDMPNLPKNLTLGAIADLELLKAYGREVARQCLELGVDSPLGPVVDVNSNPLNPIIGSRSFGDDPHEVARRALAVMEGMREGGILPCAKHFPGHGDTAVDSHFAIPLIDKTFEELKACELIPFQALIDAGVPLVMVGHMSLPLLSPFPSTLSPEIVTELLRGEMGFEGLVVTDALNMRSLLRDTSFTSVVEKAFLAGNDLLLTSTDFPPMSTYLIEKGIPEAIDHLSATIPEALLEERIRRVQAFKRGSKSNTLTPNPDLCRQLYRHALTALGETKISFADRLSLVQSHPDPLLEEALARYVDVEVFPFEEALLAPEPRLINLKKGDRHPQIPPNAIVALFDTPYAMPDHPHILVAYEDVPEMKEAVSDALFTSFTPSGKLPVRVFHEYGQVSRDMARGP